MCVARDQKGPSFLEIESIERYDLLCRPTEQVTRLKTQAEGGTGNFGDDSRTAAAIPCPEDKRPWANQPVRLPGIIVYQMTG